MRAKTSTGADGVEGTKVMVDRENPVHGVDGRALKARGSCLCGAVRYEMYGDARGVNHCHCSRCQKARGTGHATNLFLPLAEFAYTAGAELLTSYKVPEAKHFTHTFCSVCGASMPRADEARGIVIVPMGSLDDDPGARPMRHIWVESMPRWDAINDELPQFPGAPPAL